jgi:hypothetical protein
MNTVFTPPIDQHVDGHEEPIEAPQDDREMGFVLQTHPRGNGDLHEADAEYSAQRWTAVLGW